MTAAISMKAAFSEEQKMHGVPRRGYVLSTAVEEIAQHCRFAVAKIRETFEAAPNLAKPYFSDVAAPQQERAAWLAFSAWLTGQVSGLCNNDTGLGTSQAWFLGRKLTASEQRFWKKMDAVLCPVLEGIAERPGISELLPYILESHGPGSRLSVRRDPSTKVARANKRAAGVFYTPLDVASFMVRSALQDGDLGHQARVLDPAVGTGVFLKAVLAETETSSPSGNSFTRAVETLFGCDIDELALDGAASVLLADTLADALLVTSSPLAAWQALRGNLRQCDALLLDRDRRPPPGSGRVFLADIFPTVDAGFDLIIGNPPYADLGRRADLAELTARFKTIAAKPRHTADLYPVFVEQMMRLASPAASGAMVLPLSIACNSGVQFVACRELMENQPGNWQFAFFDRQPHALFGEDVKTRNAILFWKKEKGSTRIQTGPLRKWRGDDRRTMLQQVSYTAITPDIRSGIPKLHGADQGAAWKRLMEEPVRLSHFVGSWCRSTLNRVPNGTASDVFVAPTAYNFLGLARPCPLNTTAGEALSINPLIQITCGSAKDAAAAFAILSGNFAFWWWHVTGDGFHVNRNTLANLPVGASAINGRHRDRLASLGKALWKRSMEAPVRSVNRNRVSYTFAATSSPDIRREIDEIMVALLGLNSAFASELEAFTNTITAAGLFPVAQKRTREESSMAKKIAPEIKETSKLTKEEWREYTKTVWSIANKAHKEHPAAFPEEIPHRLTKLFSFYGETVLDPFAGSGTTAKAAIPLGRRAVCIEQNPDYVEIIKKECAALRNGHADAFVPLEAVEGDSRNLEFLENDSVGLIVTSPPYWDKADYGDGQNNLGNVSNYGGFLESIRPVFEECYRVLAPGRKMCVVTANVNQHTDHGLLTFPLATDFGVLLRNIGFVMVNEVIWSKDGTGGKWGSFGAQRPIFGSYPYPPNFLFKNVHEYILIFAKPPEKKTKGPKVKPYAELMGGVEQLPSFAPEDGYEDHRLPMVEV